MRLPLGTDLELSQVERCSVDVLAACGFLTCCHIDTMPPDARPQPPEEGLSPPTTSLRRSAGSAPSFGPGPAGVGWGVGWAGGGRRRKRSPKARKKNGAPRRPISPRAPENTKPQWRQPGPGGERNNTPLHAPYPILPPEWPYGLAPWATLPWV
jgi:hypothetical protein